MIACHAYADDDALTLDPSEIEDAQWFTRNEVEEAFANPDEARFVPPFPLAVAHHMLRWWLEREP
jgi:NAD+ diphosphatase